MFKLRRREWVLLGGFVVVAVVLVLCFPSRSSRVWGGEGELSGVLVGLSEEEVVGVLGSPRKVEGGSWLYRGLVRDVWGQWDEAVIVDFRDGRVRGVMVVTRAKGGF